MQKTSLRTLVLLLELFIAVVSVQYLGTIKPARASAVWLAGNGPTDLSAPTQDANDTLNT